ncbi:MAG: NUDIX hydrolase [Bdellovibrionales bacterium]|jgi:8-oxo-dGTP pyrophosphatase MutT (NUDIX family)|nr:NUDIX hydrolase [Bdellovibrionales bacterium]
MSLNNSFPSLRYVDTAQADMAGYALHLADCAILTRDGKILLQYRPPQWRSSPDTLCIFGGHVDAGEDVMDGLLRELREELGADVPRDEVVFLGAVTEAQTGHSEVVHVHFWHDRAGRITGCYEAEARHFDTVADALETGKVMEYASWALQACRARGLLP